MLVDFIPVFIMILLATGLALTLLKAAEVIGPKRPSRVKQMAYESGMDPVGTARERYSVKFYLVAMIFIVFDVEVVFMYPWAVTYRDALSSGWGLGSLVVMLIFTIILVIGLVYDLKKGGLEWD